MLRNAAWSFLIGTAAVVGQNIGAVIGHDLAEPDTGAVHVG